MSSLRTTLSILSRVAPGPTASLSSLLFTLPPRPHRPARERLVLERARASTVDSLGVPLRVWEWGHGPVVLLAHGWAGRGSQLGSFVDPLVDAGYRVVTFDQAAHGDSGGRTASLHAFAEGLRTVAEAFGGVHAVVAHSFGAMAAVIAVRRGLAVNRLAFVGPAAWTDRSVANAASRMGVTPAVIRRVREASERRYGIRWDDLLGRNLGRGLRVPLLVVHDRDDDEVPLSAVTDLADSWHGAQLVWTEGLGHRRVLGAPRVLARVTAFVASGKVPAAEDLRGVADPWSAFLHGVGRVA